MIFLGLPSLVVAAGLAALWREWRRDPSLRQEEAAALTRLRRHLVICLLAAATLLGGQILTATVAHIITD